MSPVLFLDIDGVLNALGGQTDWDDTFTIDLPPYRLALSRQMADAINALDADIVWCTTWQDDAHMVGNHIGISADYLRLGRGWKRQAVEDYMADTPRPFLWFEDAQFKYGMESQLAMDHLPPRFLCNPNPLIGITQQDIQNAQQWMDEQ